MTHAKDHKIPTLEVKRLDADLARSAGTPEALIEYMNKWDGDEHESLYTNRLLLNLSLRLLELESKTSIRY